MTLAVLQQCWIAVNGFPFLPFVICPRWVEASLLAWASPSTKVETRGATCMCFQKRSGLTQPNCLTKAYFSSFHTGPLPDPNVSLIFKFKCTNKQNKPCSNAAGVQDPKKIPGAEFLFKMLMHFLKAVLENPALF